MKKFGIGKKDKSGEDSVDDPNRGRLFGSKSKSKSPTPASTNPYAIPQSASSSDPYARSSSPYTATATTPGYESLNQPPTSGPPPYGTQSSYESYSTDPGRNNKSTVPPGGYGGNRYVGNPTQGPPQGYGSDRFKDNGIGETGGGGYQRAGGYGGLDRSYSQETMDTQAGRDALFAGAKERYEQRHATATNLPQDDSAQEHGSAGAEVPDMGYGNYQERQLTAEEEEEEDVQAAKQQIRAIKQQDVSSTRNALRIAEQAEQTGRETLERLGAQGERIHNTEKNLDLAANQNRLAEEKARELKHLNRSMWAMRVGNPFTKTRREQERDEMIISQHQSERAERDATRQAAYTSQARQQEMQRDIRGPSGLAVKKGNLGERSKYQFEADSEDEAMEDEIDSNLDALHGAAGRLNQLGRAMGKEVDSQNEHIGRIVGKADKVDDQIVMNRSRLDRIR